MRTILILLVLGSGALGQGILEIRVRWDGDLPKLKPFVLPPDFVRRNPDEAAICGNCAKEGKLVDESVVVDPKTRGIRDVAMSLDGPESPRALLPDVLTLDNQHCRFAPRVAWAPIGKPIRVKNSDGFTHNARIMGRGGRQFWNALIPAKTTVETYPVARGGLYRVVCDVHPWMQAWVIGTRNHRVGVSGVKGSVVMEDVPSQNDVTVNLWHPELGRARIQVRSEKGKRVLKVLTQKDFRKS